MDADNRIQFAADAKECAFVNFAGARVPLAKFNRWMRNPAELSDTIAALQENRERIAGQQARIRDLSQQPNREEMSR